MSDNRSSPQIQATEVLPIIISSQTDTNVALTEKTVDYLDKKTDLGFFFLERHQKKKKKNVHGFKQTSGKNLQWSELRTHISKNVFSALNIDELTL